VGLLEFRTALIFLAQSLAQQASNAYADDGIRDQVALDQS
jgi:hypothetical protein